MPSVEPFDLDHGYPKSENIIEANREMKAAARDLHPQPERYQDRPGTQQSEMRMYLDKLREIVPHVPKQGKTPKMQLIQNAIDYICDLQQALEAHPRLKGLDPRVIAAPNNILSPMQMQELLLEKQRQQALQMQQRHFQSMTAPHHNTPYTRKPLTVVSGIQPRPCLQARRDSKMARLQSALRPPTGALAPN